MYLDDIEFAKSRADSFPAQVDYLVSLVKQVKDVPGDIVEVGSWKCGCSIAMASQTYKKVYAFDLFGGLPYGPGFGFEKFGDTSIIEIVAATRPYENLHLVRGLHELTIPKHPKNPIAMIFLDSDHYSSHRVTLDNFVPLLSTGSIIAFHDWSFPAVQQAIKEIITPDKFVEFEDVQGMRAIRAL